MRNETPAQINQYIASPGPCLKSPRALRKMSPRGDGAWRVSQSLFKKRLYGA